MIAKGITSSIQCLLSDLGAVLLFPKDQTYKGKLNPLYAEFSQQENFRFFDHFVLNTELLEIYFKLKQRDIPCYSITEGVIQNDPTIQPQLSQVFTKIYSAKSLGLSKTDSQLYLNVSQEIGIEPEHTLFVDDNEENCQAAKNIGMSVYVYKSNNEFVEDLHQFILPTTRP